MAPTSRSTSLSRTRLRTRTTRHCRSNATAPPLFPSRDSFRCRCPSDPFSFGTRRLLSFFRSSTDTASYVAESPTTRLMIRLGQNLLRSVGVIRLCNHLFSSRSGKLVAPIEGLGSSKNSPPYRLAWTPEIPAGGLLQVEIRRSSAACLQIHFALFPTEARPAYGRSRHRLGLRRSA